LDQWHDFELVQGRVRQRRFDAADFCTGLLPTGLISFCRRGPSGIDSADGTSPHRADADIPRAALSKLPDCPSRRVGHPFGRWSGPSRRHTLPSCPACVPGVHVFAHSRQPRAWMTERP